MTVRKWQAEGDSISSNQMSSGDGWPARSVSSLIPSADFTLRASSGNTIANWQSRFSTVVSAMAADKTNLLSLLPGNDITFEYVASGSREAYLSDLHDLIDEYIAAGFYVLLCTTLPRNSGFNAERAICNAEMRTWSHPRLTLCDFGAHPIMGPDAASANNTLYYDGIHTTEVGSLYLVEMAVPLLNKMGVRHRVAWAA